MVLDRRDASQPCSLVEFSSSLMHVRNFLGLLIEIESLELPCNTWSRVDRPISRRKPAMNFFSSKLFTLFAVLLLAACGSSPTDDGGNDDNDGSGDTRVILTNPSFATNIQEIFVRRGCTAGSCHGAAMSGGLGLASAAASFADLVDVAAVENPNVVRVLPNDDANSYLVMKLEGSAGTRMPQGQAPLDNTDLTNIKNWINTGALNN